MIILIIYMNSEMPYDLYKWFLLNTVSSKHSHVFCCLDPGMFLNLCRLYPLNIKKDEPMALLPQEESIMLHCKDDVIGYIL